MKAQTATGIPPNGATAMQVRRKPSAKSLRAAALTPRFLRTSEAWFVLGGEQVVKDCEKTGWLKPVHRRKSMTLYRFSDVHACADRIEAGEYPGRAE